MTETNNGRTVVGRQEPATLEFPYPEGSTLEQLNRVMDISPATEADQLEYWRGLAADMLDAEARQFGVPSLRALPLLNTCGYETLIETTASHLRDVYEEYYPPASKKRGATISLSLIVAYLVNEERSIDPTAKDNRIFQHVTRILGPGVKKTAIAQAYRRGVHEIYIRSNSEDLLTQLSVGKLFLEFERLFWAEHKKSEKYAKDRALCRKLRGRKSIYEIDRSIEWAK